MNEEFALEPEVMDGGDPEDLTLDSAFAQQVLDRLVELAGGATTVGVSGEQMESPAAEVDPEEVSEPSEEAVGEDRDSDLEPVLMPLIQSAVVEQTRALIPEMSDSAERVLRQITGQLNGSALAGALRGGAAHVQLLGYAAMGMAAALEKSQEMGQPIGMANSPTTGGPAEIGPLRDEERAIYSAHLAAFGDSPKERKFILEALSEARRK